MKKLTAFLVEKSKVILILFILLAIGSAALIPMVNVNRNMTKYLSDESPMKRGLDMRTQMRPGHFWTR